MMNGPKKKIDSGYLALAHFGIFIFWNSLFPILDFAYVVSKSLHFSLSFMSWHVMDQDSKSTIRQNWKWSNGN